MKRSTLRARGWRPAREAIQVRPLGPAPASLERVAPTPMVVVDLSKPAREPDDPVYRAWVRRRPCEGGLLGLHGDWCEGIRQAHHAGKRTAKSRKAGDSTCICLCERHHTGDSGIHVLGGPFKGWKRQQLREWQDRIIVKTRSAWLIERSSA